MGNILIPSRERLHAKNVAETSRLEFDSVRVHIPIPYEHVKVPVTVVIMEKRSSESHYVKNVHSCACTYVHVFRYQYRRIYPMTHINMIAAHIHSVTMIHCQSSDQQPRAVGPMSQETILVLTSIIKCAMCRLLLVLKCTSVAGKAVRASRQSIFFFFN